MKAFHSMCVWCSLEAQVSAWRTAGGAARPDWSDAQLEELRHAQARLTRDRAAFDAQRANDHAQLAQGNFFSTTSTFS